MSNKMSTIISVEGNIGTGKSTLVQMLKENLENNRDKSWLVGVGWDQSKFSENRDHCI